jgi:type IV pilus assembly protein PilC
MSIVEALQILESTLGNYYYKEAIRDVRKDVLTGRSMYYKMSEEKYHHLFPPMLVHMIAVGEDTGDTTGMLIRTADYYDLEVETATQTMMSMMQPAIIVVLAGVVGILLAAVLSPMVSLYSQLGDAL